ncbi:LPS export ABC transporter permease LptG [Orrella sp. 11846]|uniref:LPS export ABC transporter permease LptG n=1 Tax=Orrella sp. 11846 TaxID=3409913 RepID=UPI003B5A8C6A
MSTARRYLAREIYRSSLIVLVALLGFFTFFSLVDQLDTVSDNFPMSALLYLETLALPSRLYELLPLGILVGAVLALAGLAQRNELTILRVSGMSSYRLLRMLWITSIPVILFALLLSEVLTPAADVRYSEANLMMRSRVEGGRFNSGYWFKEPTETGGYRIINIGQLLSSGDVGDVMLYEFDPEGKFLTLTKAGTASVKNDRIQLKDATINKLPSDAMQSLSEAKPLDQPLMMLTQEPIVEFASSLTPERLVARILVPERMSLLSLWDYTQYMKANGLTTDRQEVALWRKLAYPFTILVMLSIAAPIAYLQIRRGGVASKIFVGILVGTIFFMISQLSLNVGTLYRWNPILTALLPNGIALILAIFTLLRMERRLGPKESKKLSDPVRAEPLEPSL